MTRVLGYSACALAFDHPDDERSRSIIFATDNEVNGASIVTLEEAAAYAKSVGVRVFALNPVQGKDAEISAQLAEAAEVTGGTAYGERHSAIVAAARGQAGRGRPEPGGTGRKDAFGDTPTRAHRALRA